MTILDRQRYWNFLKAYIICFVSLVGLYVVIHAFENLDEFARRADGTLDLLGIMGWYYLIHMSEFYDRLCGVIGMMAAIFTVTWMQKNNELIAVLAAGVSTQRAIRPVLISAVLVSSLAVINQECILSRLGEELQRRPDDDGQVKVMVYARSDINWVLVHGKEGHRVEQTINPFYATLPPDVFGKLVELEAKQARYIPDDDPNCPLRGGWLLHDAQITPVGTEIDGKVGKVLIELKPEDLKDYPPPVKFPGDAKQPPPPSPSRNARAARTFFLRTNVTFAAVTRNRQWYQFASTPDLLQALTDPVCKAERLEIAVFLHSRLLRPLLGFALMAVSLPLVLSGENRNTFINLGLSLGTSALFYAGVFIAQYLGNNEVIVPELAGWLPLFVFGTVAIARWDRIRT